MAADQSRVISYIRTHLVGWSQEQHRPPTTATKSNNILYAIFVDVKGLGVQHPSSSATARGAHQAPRRRLFSGWAFNLTFDL